MFIWVALEKKDLKIRPFAYIVRLDLTKLPILCPIMPPCPGKASSLGKIVKISAWCRKFCLTKNFVRRIFVR